MTRVTGECPEWQSKRTGNPLGDEGDGRPGCGRDRQLGRLTRPVLVAALSAARQARPSDRLLALAPALLVVVGTGCDRSRLAPAEPVAPRTVLHRRLRHARRG